MAGEPDSGFSRRRRYAMVARPKAEAESMSVVYSSENWVNEVIGVVAGWNTHVVPSLTQLFMVSF